MQFLEIPELINTIKAEYNTAGNYRQFSIMKKQF